MDPVHVQHCLQHGDGGAVLCSGEWRHCTPCITCVIKRRTKHCKWTSLCLTILRFVLAGLFVEWWQLSDWSRTRASVVMLISVRTNWRRATGNDDGRAICIPASVFHPVGARCRIYVIVCRQYNVMSSRHRWTCTRRNDMMLFITLSRALPYHYQIRSLSTEHADSGGVCLKVFEQHTVNSESIC